MQPNEPLFITRPSRSQLTTILPWADPTIDRRGHDPRSAYVETFWLGVIGPTATWIIRRFADEFDHAPDGFTIDLHRTAGSMGVSYAKGPASPFGRALNRCVMFGLATELSSGVGFAFRRRVPQVGIKHLQRLPTELAEVHDAWVRAALAAEPATTL
jgi:hypothetical protein